MMDSPQPSQDLFDTIHELAHAILNGRGSDSQHQQLEELIAGDEEACRIYLDYIRESVVLRASNRVRSVKDWLIAAETSGRDAQGQAAKGLEPPVATGSPVETRAAVPARRSWRLVRTFTAGVLACAVVVLSYAGWTNWSTRGSSQDETPAAKIVQSVDASWSRDGESLSLSTGNWLPYGRYSLTRGVAQIVFPWGAEVTFEAPAEFELSADGTRRLFSGRLIAKVSSEDTGFTIDTPTVEVVDLGTEFGISAEANGESEVHVFKGAVEARQRYGETSAAPLKLGAGEATIFGHEDNPVRRILYNPQRFSRAWRVASRIAGTSGGMRFVHPAPASVVEGHTDSNRSLQLFQESESHVLQQPTAVTIAQPGFYTAFNGRATWLPAGCSVDSYMVHFDPRGGPGDLSPVTVKGTVTFDRPILAVIARSDQLAATDAALGSAEIEYSPVTKLEDVLGRGYLRSPLPPRYSRGLCGLFHPSMVMRESAAPDDWIRISDDRRTLTLCCTSNGSAEQIRILVASEDEPSLQVIETPALPAPRPYRARPFEVGKTIEAEDFDLGGDGVAYYDNTPDLLANTYRTLDSVELQSFASNDRGGTVVSYTRAGEWIAYTIQIPKAGPYVLQAHVASRFGGGRFRAEFDDSATTGSLVVPLTEPEPAPFPLDGFQTIESSPVVLEAGTHVMRIIMEHNHQAGWIGDFDWFRIEPASDSPTESRTSATAVE